MCGVFSAVRTTSAAIALTILATTPLAQAETSKTTAEALFQEARRLIEAGRWAEACPKLSASLELDPTANGTRLNLARCHAETGHVASAWAAARETLAEARRTNDAKRAAAAEQILAEVEPRLPKLVIRVADQGPASLVVQRDGIRLDKAAWGVRVPVDPGDHVVAAEAPGKEAWSTSARIDMKQTVEIDVPVLRDAPVKREAAPSTVDGAPPPPGGSSARRVVGLSAAGLGVVALGVGTVFGLQARSAWEDSQPRCFNDVCDPEGHRLAEDASAKATVSTIAFAAGAVLLVGGLVLWLTAPSKSAPARASIPYVGRW